jgi:hypothetical protein
MTTKLEIINAMLASVGSDPQSDPDSQHPDAVAAREQIAGKLEEVLLERWWFNTDYALKLVPNAQGEIVLPSNTLRVDPSDTSAVFVQRGTRLYDPVNHTYEIGAEVYVDISINMEVEELPAVAGAYLKALCKRSYYIDQDGDDNKAAQYLRDLNIALAALKKQHLSSLNLNATSRPRVAAILGGIRPAVTYTGSRNPNYPGGFPK